MNSTITRITFHVMNRVVFFRILCSLLIVVCFSSARLALWAAEMAQRWEVVELPFETEQEVQGPFAVEFGAVFRGPAGSTLHVPGFYNGGDQWLIRFCPPKVGRWTFSTVSSLPDLAGESGVITVTENTRDWQRGPIEISQKNPQRFIYADGTPYFLMAFELDWLFALDAENGGHFPRAAV